MDTRSDIRSRRRSYGPVRLDRLAQDCLGPAIARYGFGSAEILAAWPEIVGAELAGRSRPERVRWPRLRDENAPQAATLVVRAEGGDAVELQHLAPQIIERVNAFFGWRAIGRVKMRQAPVPGPAAAGRERSARRRPESPKPAPGLSAIDDPGLRDALERLGRHVGGRADNST